MIRILTIVLAIAACRSSEQSDPGAAAAGGARTIPAWLDKPEPLSLRNRAKTLADKRRSFAPIDGANALVQMHGRPCGYQQWTLDRISRIGDVAIAPGQILVDGVPHPIEHYGSFMGLPVVVAELEPGVSVEVMLEDSGDAALIVARGTSWCGDAALRGLR